MLLHNPIETLEPRTLLAAAPILINFQPPDATVPDGYLLDAGAAYGRRGNGFTYGWNRVNYFTADRNSDLASDQRYDTVIRTQVLRNYTWDIALPNGQYHVRIAAGDPIDTDGAVYGFDVEGVAALRGTATAATPYIESTTTVSVTDGRLTLSNASGARRNAINFIEIRETAPIDLTATARSSSRIDLAWQNNVPGATGFRIERSIGNAGFSVIATVGSNVTSYRDSSLQSGTTYRYRIHALGDNSALIHATAQAATQAMSSFRWYDGTAFLNKPDLSAHGIGPIYVTGTEVFAGDNRNTPNEAATRALARKVAALNQLLVIDIEHWPVDIRVDADAQVRESIGKLSQIMDWLHSERPGLQVGLYGIMPLRDYWTPVNYLNAVERAPREAWWANNLPRFKAAHEAWQAANDRLRPLVAKVDFLAPSIYTFYNAPSDWVKYATANLQEAHRISDKPVVPFIWMDYHDGTPLQGQSLPADYWRLELDTVMKNAQGAIVWGGWRPQAGGGAYRATWDNSAPWWTTLREVAAQAGS